MAKARKPSSVEDEFIAREEAKQKELAQIRREQAEEAAAREARRLTCPGGCATKLVEEAFRDIAIDRCPTCKGVWLDPGELEKIAVDDASIVRSVFGFFAGKTPV
jgi:predicted Zn-ribbon and HTH transcriptional regulator